MIVAFLDDLRALLLITLVPSNFTVEFVPRLIVVLVSMCPVGFAYLVIHLLNTCDIIACVPSDNLIPNYCFFFLLSSKIRV